MNAASEQEPTGKMEHWALVLSLATAERLKSCIPARDQRGRLCQGYLFHDEESARRFAARLEQQQSLPPVFFYESPRLVAIRFVASMYDRALYDGLRWAMN